MLIVLVQINIQIGMGSSDSKTNAKQEIKAKNKRQIEMLYKMFDQTVKTSQDFRIRLSESSKSSQMSNPQKSKISNLDEVLEQLLSTFKENKRYGWSRDIYRQFKKHFSHCFEQFWFMSKQDFYKIILVQCKFQTLDFQTQLNEIAKNKDHQVPDRNSFQKFFYEVGAAKLYSNLPSSILEDGVNWEEQIIKQNQEDKNQFNFNAINATILNNEFDPHIFEQSYAEKPEDPDSDFLPLFINARGSKILTSDKKLGENKMKSEAESQKSTKQKIMEARIQNSSLIAPETIFLNRLAEDAKKQIGDLVKFYKQFGNALQMMLFSVSLLSAPFKHFTFLLTQKMNRKKISNKRKIQKSFPHKNQKLNQFQNLLYGQTAQAFEFRSRRQINNTFLLDQIRDFTQAYTDFIWKYLQLTEISELKLGRLITVDALYGIVLKAVWKFVQFISDRGFQYEERKLEEYYQTHQISNVTSLPQEKKKYLLRILKTLKGQRNPQKYLKKIVVFYRQVSCLGECADDLLNIYEELLGRMIKDRSTRQLGLFRMKNIIEKVLNIDDSYSGGGQIGYSWTTWCIVLELLKNKVAKPKIPKYEPSLKAKVSNIVTEPDVELYYEDEEI